MRVFVTGATGYIGREVCRALHRAGHGVTGLAREQERATLAHFDGLNWVIGNLRDGRTYRSEALGGDAVIHLGSEIGPDNEAVDRNAVDTLLDVAGRRGAKHVLVYTSGVWVLGPTGDAHVDETTPVENPAAVVVWRPTHERDVLAAAGPSLVTAVIRPGIVYGGRGGLTDGFFSQAVMKGRPTIIGDGHNRWTCVHRSDLAELYVRLLELAFSDPFLALPKEERLFHAVAGEPERVADMARAASRAAGGADAVGFWPVDEAREKLGPFADALALDQVVCSCRSDEILGWRPRFRSFSRNAPELFAEWKSGG